MIFRDAELARGLFDRIAPQEAQGQHLAVSIGQPVEKPARALRGYLVSRRRAGRVRVGHVQVPQRSLGDAAAPSPVVRKSSTRYLVQPGLHAQGIALRLELPDGL